MCAAQVRGTEPIGMACANSVAFRNLIFLTSVRKPKRAREPEVGPGPDRKSKCSSSSSSHLSPKVRKTLGGTVEQFYSAHMGSLSQPQITATVQVNRFHICEKQCVHTCVICSVYAICHPKQPTLYRSVIEDVIERVRNLFAEEGIEEQVLKDLKQLWETKVLQSKATEDLFTNSVHSPLYTLQLPHGVHQTLQTSAASLVIPAGRSIPTLTTAELGTSNSSANFTFPSSIGYPIHVPAGVTLQTASGHLYKVNVPIIVTQTPGRASILQHPIQQVFQQLGQPSVIQTGIPQLSPSSLHATTEKPLRPETVFQQPTILYSGAVDRKQVENVTTDIFVPPGNEHKVMSEALLSQQESPQLISVPGVVFAPQVSQLDSSVKLSVSTRMTQTLPGGPLSAGPRGALHQHLPDVQLRVLKNRMHGCDSVKQPRNIEEPNSLPVSEKDSNSQKDLSTPSTDDDFNEIIQIDGAGDISSSEEIGSSRDVDGNDFLGMVDAEQLKLLEEEGDSISNEDSTVNSNDNEDSQTEIVEEDPLNSGDDDSEQDVPDLFDTDNVIVCQYDKIHRNKNKWKFYLKDGVMCFGGKDFVFAKAIGDAEW